VKIINKNTALFLTGNIMTYLGNSIFAFLVSWFVVKETGSTQVLGLIISISLLPSIFFNFLFGKVVDTFDRKQILVVSDITSGIISLIAYYYFRETNNIYVLGALFITLNITKTLFGIASKSIVTDLVESDKLKSFNSLKVLVKEISRVLGPLVGGLLLLYYKPSVLILINGISFILSGLSEIMIKTNKGKVVRKKASWFGGLEFIKCNCKLLNIVIFSSILNFVLTGFNLYLPYLSIEILADDRLLAVLLTAESIGVLFAPIAIKLFNKIKIKIDFNRSAMGCGISLLTLLFGIHQINLVVSIFFFSVFLTIYNINFFSYLQETVPRDISGRVFGTITSIALVLMPVGNIVFGFLGPKLHVYGLSVIGFLILLVKILFLDNKVLLFKRRKYQQIPE